MIGKLRLQNPHGQAEKHPKRGKHAGKKWQKLTLYKRTSESVQIHAFAPVSASGRICTGRHCEYFQRCVGKSGVTPIRFLVIPLNQASSTLFALRERDLLLLLKLSGCAVKSDVEVDIRGKVVAQRLA